MDSSDSPVNAISSKSRVFRYHYDEVESIDSYGSPPSLDDGGFVHFNKTKHQKPRISTFDRINQEIMLAVQEQDGPLTPVTPISEPTTPSSGIEVAIRKNGLVLQPFITPDQENQTETLDKSTPLILGPVTVNEPPTDESMKKYSTEKKLLPVKQKYSLTEKVNQLYNQIESPFVTPASTPFATPLSTPLTTPQGSPKAQKKLSAEKLQGIVMEKKTSVNSYFYQGNVYSNTGTSLSLPNTGTPKTSQSVAGIAEDAALPPQARKRKPKPSSLREMNFWAPTSM